MRELKNIEFLTILTILVLVWSFGNFKNSRFLNPKVLYEGGPEFKANPPIPLIHLINDLKILCIYNNIVK